MAKISSYPNGGDVQAGDYLIIARGGRNYKVLRSGLAIPEDLWVLWVGNTWVYASASTFTISGDQTAILVKGTRLKFTQGGVTKYATVKTSSYGAPNTTVTIIVNTDYTIANSAISAPYYSYSENPLGWPGFFTYAGTWTAVTTNPTIGNGSIASKYNPGRTLMFVKFGVLMGSTTTFGTGLYSFSIPVPSSGFVSSIAIESASGNVLDSDAATRYALSSFIRANDIRGVYANSIMSQIWPITFAQNDVINLSGSYEW